MNRIRLPCPAGKRCCVSCCRRRRIPVQGSSTAFKRGRVEVCLQPELKAIEKAKSLEAPAGMLEEILSEME